MEVTRPGPKSRCPGEPVSDSQNHPQHASEFGDLEKENMSRGLEARLDLALSSLGQARVGQHTGRKCPVVFPWCPQSLSECKI